jgi:cytochrome c-type biogenesis protein CcmH
VMAMLQGQSAIGAPEKLIERALKLDPKNLKALALAGSIAFERKDFSAATNFWTQARQLAPPGGEFAKGLDSSLEAAQSAGGGASGGTASTAGNAPGSAIDAANSTAKHDVTSSAADTGKAKANANANATNITGVVSLSAALAAKVAPDDTVFIFARAAEGPRMPLAILRRKASELPISFSLDDSTAMSPEMKLSKFAQVVVGARISKSGNAMPQPGDLVGQAGPLSPPADKLGIMIDGVQQ